MDVVHQLISPYLKVHAVPVYHEAKGLCKNFAEVIGENFAEDS